MFKSLKYILGAGFIACATAAAAEGLPPEVRDNVMNTCRADYHRVCSFVVPGEGRVARCLIDHETELAPPCLKAIKLAYAMEVCLPDYHRFCNGVAPGGGQIVECLANRIEALAPECRRVVSANAPYAGPGRERYTSYSSPAPYPQAYSYGPGPGPGAYSGGRGAYPYGPRAGEGEPYAYDQGANPGRSYEDRYADHSYDRYPQQPYGDGRYPDRGYDNPSYPAPEEEHEPVK
jgi:hypothetical protein